MEQQRKIILLVCVGILLAMTFYEFNGIKFLSKFGNCIDQLFNTNNQKETFLSENEENIDQLKPIEFDQCDKKMDATLNNKHKRLNHYCKGNAITQFIKKNYIYLLKNYHILNKRVYKRFSTEDIGVSKIFKGEFITFVGKIPNHPRRIRTLKVMKEEALAIARKDNLCSAVSVGNTLGNQFGKAIFWNNSTRFNLKNKSEITTYIKKYNIAYTIMFWVQITNEGTLNNFFHHGNKKTTCYPSLNIEPNSSSLSIDISIYKDDKKSVQHITLQDLELRKWTHVAMIFNTNIMTLFINGNEQSNQELDGDIEWPGSNERLFFSSPWNNNTENCQLYDFIWIPHVITQSLVHGHYLSNKSLSFLGT